MARIDLALTVRTKRQVPVNFVALVVSATPYPDRCVRLRLFRYTQTPDVHKFVGCNTVLLYRYYPNRLANKYLHARGDKR